MAGTSSKVVDPALLALLDAPDTAAPKKVTDPALLAQLEGTAPDAPTANAWDRTGAVGEGANAGIAALGGLPVDTLLNVWDLAKAGAGTVQGTVTGKAPSGIFDPTDRSQFTGSSQWIRDQFDKNDVTNTQLAHPEDAASRYLHVAGSALPGVAISAPQTIGQGLTATAANLAPALVGQGTTDITRGTKFESPSLGILMASLANGRMIPGRSTPKGLTPSQQTAIENGEALGMRTTPGQATGNKALQMVEAKLESNPWTAGPFNKVKTENQRALNRHWARAIGEESEHVDSTTLANAAERLGNEFETARSPKSIVMADPKKTTQVLDDINAQNEGVIQGSIRDNPIVKQIEDTLTTKGAANGEQLGKWSSQLGKRAHKEMTSLSGDRDLGQALYQVKDHVDDLLGSGMSPKELAAYNTTRKQYRALKQLTSRVNNLNPTTGDISGGNLANYLQKSDQKGYLFGKNDSDAYNATRFSQAVKPVVGDSGTATRTADWKPHGLFDAVAKTAGSVGSMLYMSKHGQRLVRALSDAPGAAPQRFVQKITNAATTPEEQKLLSALTRKN
jgi:hypothetical protein